MNLENIRIVLTRPLYGGNVGSVCRAMMNMGLSDLAIVSPSLGLYEVEVRKMSLHAVELYNKRSDFKTLAEAVADCHVVAGATARGGLYRAHSKTIRDWAPDLIASAQVGKVALVFGPEDDGLNNDEVALCNRLIEIPSTERYRSINLAQAVMICCYELYTAADLYEHDPERSPEATSIQRERMYEFWEKSLVNIGFMDDETSEHMMQGVRRILSRGGLTDRDVRILIGIARQADWVADELRKFRDFD